MQKKTESTRTSAAREHLACMKHESTQREFAFVNWGGKRRGAGRKPKGERALVSRQAAEAV